MRAATNIIATESEAAASGIITYWSLSGYVRCRKLWEEWVRAGLDERHLPNPPSALVALRRAMDAVAPSGSIIKPLKQEEGYTVIQKSGEEGARQTWETKFSAFISTVGKVTVWVEDVAEGVNTSERLAGTLEDLMEMELAQLHPGDLSTWFVSTIEKRLQALALRDTGGFYFVPRGEAQQEWERMAKVVESVSATRILTIPAMHSEQATLAVLHALTEEINSRTKEMGVALEEARMGRRALDTKIAQATSMLEKIDTYEGLLGERLTNLRDAVDTLKARYVEAWSVENARNDR